ncbi:MAG: hypothetical protein JWM33_2019 [Caulobacteraceae bacterium]|nr:hypothetical protein [Caulobacteraceae bacterium]
MRQSVAQGLSYMGELARLISAKPGENRLVVLAFTYFFFLLAAYYVLRPVRDSMGVQGGLGRLPNLFVWTFIGALVVAPAFCALVCRVRRRILVPLVYGFLLANLLAFWALLSSHIEVNAVGWAFYVWVSVFATFAVSIFWSFMADLFTAEQAVRLYPTIVAGGALGAVVGSATVTTLAHVLGAENLILVAVVLLALAATTALRLDRAVAEGEAPQRELAIETAEHAVGGGWADGFVAIFRSPYLAGLSLWVVLLSLAGAISYYEQVAIVRASGLMADDRTAFFGRVDLIGNLLSPVVQLTLARWAMRRGVGGALGVVAVAFMASLLLLAFSPTLTCLVWALVIQRVGQFGLSNPARESLWPAAARADKYKAKSVVDNVVFRGADALSTLLLTAVSGLGLPALSLGATPVMALWLALSVRLGRQRRALAEAFDAETKKAGVTAGLNQLS